MASRRFLNPALLREQLGFRAPVRWLRQYLQVRDDAIYLGFRRFPRFARWFFRNHWRKAVSRESLAEHQLDCELGYNILLQIYGFEDLMIPRGDLPVVYSIIVEQRESAGESRKGRRLARKLKRGLLKHIHREIERLVQLEEKVRKQQNERLSCEARTHMVPMVSERLMRYDTTLSRDIQRTMIQLEHLQRRRRGEGDLPPIQLDISS